MTDTTPLDTDAIAARIADTLAYYHCRSVNPKADHPRMGYHAMGNEQKTFLRGKQAEAAAEVVRIIQEREAGLRAEVKRQAGLLAQVREFANELQVRGSQDRAIVGKQFYAILNDESEAGE